MIVSKTPLRASLFGGGTDFKDYFTNGKYGYGSVISVALNIHIYVIINKRFDDKIRLVYFGNELVDSVDEIKHNIIREALKMLNIKSGIEIIYLANIPMTDLGLGLASSSALTVGLLNALHEYKKERVSKEQLAKEAIDLEINHLGQQIGIQDQYEVSYGGFRRYIFNQDETVDIKDINMPQKLRDNILLFYTGKPRDSKEIFIEQKQTIQDKTKIFDDLVEITNKAMSLLDKEKYDDIGYLLNEAWQLKKQFASGVSNKSINEMYDTAIDAGALGGKILGAGGGGFLILYVPNKNQEKVRKALKDYKEIKFDIDYEGTQIVFKD